MTSHLFIGVDIGGSHIGFGVVDCSTGKLLQSLYTPINGDIITPYELLTTIVDHLNSLLYIQNILYSEVLGIGIGCPGQINDNTLIAASNFPRLSNMPLAKLVQQAFHDIPTVLMNDADSAICAEVYGNTEIYGSYQNIVMVTLGTGVGFAAIINNNLFQGSHGLLEGGHMIVSDKADAVCCGCGQKGCVEAFASAKSLTLRCKELLLQQQQANSSSDVAVDINSIEGSKDVFSLLKSQNNPAAAQAIEEAVDHLCIMLLNITRVIDPQVIILGGGLSKAGDVLLAMIKDKVRLISWNVLPMPYEIVLESTNHDGDNDNGIVGAAKAAHHMYIAGLEMRTTIDGKNEIHLEKKYDENRQEGSITIENSNGGELRTLCQVLGPVLVISSLSLLFAKWNIGNKYHKKLLHEMLPIMHKNIGLLSQLGLGLYTIYKAYM